MSLSNKLYTIVAPVRIYPGSSNFISTINELLFDLKNMCTFRHVRKVSILRLVFQILFGIIFLPFSTALYLCGYRVIFGTIFNQIGDVCFLDCVIKREKLLGSSKKLVLILGECEKGNRYLVKRYSEYVKIKEWPNFSSLIWCACSINPLLRIDIVKLDSNDQKSTFSKINRVWFKKSFKPLLCPEEYNNEWNNIPLKLVSHLQSGNFVCIHSRDIGFYQDAKSTTRNYNIQTTTKLIQLLINMGIAVIRIGQKPEFTIETNCLSNADYYFDSCNIASAEQDVFFLSNCLFYIGCSSGPAEVPGLYGNKSFLINRYPVVKGKGFFPGDITIFKKIKNINTGQYLSFEKYFSEPYELPLMHFNLANLGYNLEDNDSEEIMIGFNEFLYINRFSYPSLYKQISNKNKSDILSGVNSGFCQSDTFMKPRHWTYRSLGSYSKLFISLYLDKQLNSSIKVGD